MAVAATAPGPKLSFVQSLIYRPGGANPLDFFTKLARTYGDVTSHGWPEQLFLINEPKLIRDGFVTHNGNFTKSRARTEQAPARPGSADQRRRVPTGSGARCSRRFTAIGWPDTAT
jgi:hypothetical protein